MCVWLLSSLLEQLSEGKAPWECSHSHCVADVCESYLFLDVCRGLFCFISRPLLSHFVFAEAQHSVKNMFYNSFTVLSTIIKTPNKGISFVKMVFHSLSAETCRINANDAMTASTKQPPRWNPWVKIHFCHIYMCKA